jgi:hypothetical protein
MQQHEFIGHVDLDGVLGKARHGLPQVTRKTPRYRRALFLEPFHHAADCPVPISPPSVAIGMPRLLSSVEMPSRSFSTQRTLALPLSQRR